MPFYGLLDLTWFGYVLATLVLTHVTIAAVTIFLHRHQAHRSLDIHPVLSHFFRVWLWLTTGMSTRAWAAIHRKHHAKCETKEDPHSPQVLGLKKVLFEGAELYRKEADNEETIERYGQGTPNDWLERNLYQSRPNLGILSSLLIFLILFGIPGAIVWAVQMSWIPFFAAGVINGVGHYVGYRNFECEDASTNIVPWGILIGGEELHNNHHTYPTSAKFSVKWWEFDLAWLYIRVLQALGLATVKRISPQAKTIPGKSQIDGDTLKALINNRFQVMARYSKDVILPVFRQERQKVNNPNVDEGLWRRIKSTLIRADILVDEKGRKGLEAFLDKNQALQVVYSFRRKLQAIWERTTASQKELVEALHDWCRQAEETGIKVLEDFANYIRSYSLAGNYIKV